MLDKNSLKESFAALGVREGMHLMAHSSLSRFGYVEGGADAVIDALMELITPEGTLMMPSFNHGVCYSQGEIFSLARTPTINGIIPETFRKREGVLRSVNPTHSFAAWGKNALRYIANHQQVPTMGKGSPLDLLMQDGGYCLLMGVGYHNNTFHHFVEMDVGAPCLGPYSEEYPVELTDGQIVPARTWGWRNGRCPIDDTFSYGEEMAAVDRKMQIGEATVTLYALQEGYEIIARGLREGRNGNPPCKDCPIRPRVCEWTKE